MFHIAPNIKTQKPAIEIIKPVRYSFFGLFWPTKKNMPTVTVTTDRITINSKIRF